METNKYINALKSHPFTLSDEQVTEKVNKLLSDKFKENNTQEVYKKIYSCIDLTTLNTTDCKEDVWKFTEKVNVFEDDNPEMQNVAAICVFPNFAKTVKEALTVDVKIACVFTERSKCFGGKCKWHLNYGAVGRECYLAYIIPGITFPLF